MTTALILACYHHSPDVEIAHSLPFMHSWTILFWIFLLVFGPLLLVEAIQRGAERPMRLWLYGLLAVLMAPFTFGFTAQLFLLLPVFVYSAGHSLGAERGTRAFRAVTRASLVAMVLLVPIAYVRVRWQLGPLGFSLLRLSLPTMITHGVVAICAVVGLASLGFSVGRGNRLAPPVAPSPRPRGWRLNQERATQRVHRAPVAVQKHQACPMCWELLLSPGREDLLSYCPDCRTVLHRDCAEELGCCPTLACQRRAQRRLPRQLPPNRTLTIAARPRLQPVVGVAIP